MLKAVAKSFLVSAMVAGLCTPIMADDGIKFGGNFREYVGQYDSGVKDEAAHIENRGEANLQTKASKESMSAYFEVEARDNDSMNGEMVFATQRWIQYKEGALNVRVGTILNPATVGFTNPLATSGLYKVGGVFDAAFHGGLTEADGLKVGYKVGDINLGVTLYGSASSKLNTQNAKMVKLSPEYSGQSLQTTADGKIGAIAFRFAYTSETIDDYTDPTDDALSNTMMHLGAKVPMGQFAFALDYSSAKMGMISGTKSFDNDFSSTTLMASMKDLGPGKLSLSYEMSDVKSDGNDVKSSTAINLVYDIPIIKGAGARVVYLTRATDFASATKDDTTSSFTGFGLYAKY